MPGGMVERLQERMPNQHWSFGWGMTETNGGGASNTDEGLVDRPDSSGRPSPIAWLKVVDPDGNELPPRRAGGAAHEVADEHPRLLAAPGGHRGVDSGRMAPYR